DAPATPAEALELLCYFLRGGIRLGYTSSIEGVRQPIIAFMTRVLVELSLDLLDRDFSRPWLGPHPRIFHRELVENRVFIGARDAFNHVQVLGSRERSQVCEIGGVHHQRVTLPVADRVA